ncbi:MAG TPA: SDR family oxidoreductase [Smithella sp.]|nr:MAG: 3-alpha-(or 20-beta)-hydroxysteroid dehydrogenase [Deltaproteobacteria bacterium ADurb.Bin151]HOG91639.1 SDR family oxidoreductase [Smithella sp.]HOQ42314.1 SDR family oxidoreductase [Smithellaceae bacterium]HPL67685.1 SDR family oxidoreductase [Smithellaceae bacterium]HPN87621.1 SDR family oxidoreductase [Smithella sp.]
MKDLFSVKGKVIILTGGSGFLGAQFKRHLTLCGAEVVILDVKAKNPVDITNPEDVKKAVDRTVIAHKRIDGMVNVAAINAVPESETSKNFWKPYEKYPLELWKKELEVNLTAAHIVTQAVAPVMMKQKSGAIVFLASDLAIIAPNNSIYEEGNFKDIAYVTSKTGLLGLMRSWASYLGRYNVRVNAAVPGGMFNGHPDGFVEKNSALNMLGRMAKKDEYNGVIQFLLSDASSYMTGATLVVDGGRTAW